MKDKQKALNTWKKHLDFSTGIDRLQYVKACVDEYIQVVTHGTPPPTTTIDTTGKQSLVKNVYHKKFFFTSEDIQQCTQFSCMVCEKPLTEPLWIHNNHFMNTSSPICQVCIGG